RLEYVQAVLVAAQEFVENVRGVIVTDGDVLAHSAALISSAADAGDRVDPFWGFMRDEAAFGHIRSVPCCCATQMRVVGESTGRLEAVGRAAASGCPCVVEKDHKRLH